jgi:diadenosine tetraphosphatase ApaH/serine/threonine PP2A family protein phosphatase
MSALLVHASPQDPLYRAVGPDAAKWAAELDGVDANLVLVGHTHIQFDLIVRGRRVVNPGSVGFPLDGDPHAGFAILDQSSITLRRVPYRIEATLEAVQQSGVSGRVAHELAAWLRSGRAPVRAVPLPRAPGC